MCLFVNLGMISGLVLKLCYWLVILLIFGGVGVYACGFVGFIVGFVVRWGCCGIAFIS